MPESSTIKCARCPFEGDVLINMHPIGGTTIGPMVDFGMAVRFFCEPCFDAVRANPKEKARLDKFMDDAALWAKASMEQISDTDLDEMENLPDGLKITPSARARWSVLKNKLDKVPELQDEKDLAILHRICRNVNKNTYQHPKTGKRKEYDDLKKDLAKLEKLTPDERKRFDV